MKVKYLKFAILFLLILTTNIFLISQFWHLGILYQSDITFSFTLFDIFPIYIKEAAFSVISLLGLYYYWLTFWKDKNVEQKKKHISNLYKDILYFSVALFGAILLGYVLPTEYQGFMEVFTPITIVILATSFFYVSYVKYEVEKEIDIPD